MSLPIHSAAARSAATGGPGRSGAAFHDPSVFTEVFLGAFRRDLMSFYPGARIERESSLVLAGEPSSPPRVSPTFGLDFQLEEGGEGAEDSTRVSLFGVWYRLSCPPGMGLGPRDHELIRAIGRVLELHHQVLFRWSRVSLLQLRRGMPEDHYIAACIEPAAYSESAAARSRIAEAILTLRTLALSTYENRRVTAGALILGSAMVGESGPVLPFRPTSPQALAFGVELTGLRTLHRLSDGRRTLFLVDEQGRLADLVDIRNWAIGEWLRPGGGTDDDPLEAAAPGGSPPPGGHDPNLPLGTPCARAYLFHALATRKGGHTCLVLSPNQEIKVFARGVQAFVFAHGRWRVQDPESKYRRWEQAVSHPVLARILFQTALDLAEERQGGLFVVVSDPAEAIGRLVAPQDVLEFQDAAGDEGADQESPARPFSLFGLTFAPDAATAERAEPAPRPEGASMAAMTAPLSKRSTHYLARGCSVMSIDPAVLVSLAALDGALVADAQGRLIAFGAILQHDARSLSGPDPRVPPPVAEGARTTAALVASQFGPVLKISEDGIVSCFLDGTRAWDL